MIQEGQPSAARVQWLTRERARLQPSRHHAHWLDGPPTATLADPAKDPSGAARAQRWIEREGLAAACARFATHLKDAPRVGRHRLPAHAFAIAAVLRHALANVSEPEYIRARDAMGPHPDDLVSQAFWASVLTHDEALACTAARHFLRAQQPAPLARAFASFLTDSRLAMKLARATASSPYAYFDLSPDLLAHLGVDAVPIFAYWLMERWSDRSVLPVARTLAMVESETAGRALLPLLASTTLRPAARRWAKANRACALPMLSALAEDPDDDALDMAQRGELASVVEPLLHELSGATVTRAEFPREAPRALRSGPVKRPRFVSLDRLPRLHVSGGEPLPPEATGRWVALLAAEQDDLLTLVDRACDPETLRSCAEALHSAWCENGGTRRDAWIFTGLRRYVREDDLGALALHAERAQGAGRWRHAESLVRALAHRATPFSLLHLERLAQQTMYPKLRERVHQAITEVAREAGFGRHEFLDERMPTLGLDAHGSLSLKLGARELTVMLDERARPVLRDACGHRFERFVAWREGDDRGAHARARTQFQWLQDNANQVAGYIRGRLESMMIEERSVSAISFQRNFVAHPVAGRLISSLVLRVDHGAMTVRVLEDGACVDVNEEPVDLGDAKAIGVAHPLHLSPGETEAWSEQLADYGLTQPFPQLGRRAFVGGGVAQLEGLIGDERPWERFDQLRRHGFAGSSRDGIRVTSLAREILGVARLTLEIEPGLHVGSAFGSGSQRVVRATITPVSGVPQLTLVQRSEALLTLEGIV